MAVRQVYSCGNFIRYLVRNRNGGGTHARDDGRGRETLRAMVIRAARNIESASLTFMIADVIAIQDNFIHAGRKESAE